MFSMAFSDLRDFIDFLDRSGELAKVEAEVQPDLEIAAITDKVCKLPGGGSALIFCNISGSSIPVAANLFGSESRISAALGCKNLDQLTGWMGSILEQFSGGTSSERLLALSRSKLWYDHGPANNDFPSDLVETGIESLDLLPCPKCSPEDGSPDQRGRFLTLPLVITASPDNGEINCGMYRVALLGKDRMAVRWSESSGAAAHAAKWRAINKPMPVAVVLGGPPSLTFTATLPLPDFLDEFSFAGLLQGSPIDTCMTHEGLPFPLSAELLIEAYLEEGELVIDGPFGNHTGCYQPAAMLPLLRAESVRMRHGMIFPTTVVGTPPMEDCWIARGWERLLLPLLQLDFPSITDIHRPFGAIFHGATVISADNSYWLSSKPLMTELAGSRWLKGSRMLVLVDAGQSPSDIENVFWNVMNNADWEQDLHLCRKTLLIDGTRKSVDSRRQVVPDQAVKEMVAKRWKEFGIDNVS